ncbi:hypothetical protein TNCT_518321 [Trichonephila clavata]|uniref:Uncharacterized protein n=1 Tax=Trichonephila clavata TaxID=2740835 RepID=A0A8X6LA19_TRICU|nr:hypothetical protein TNCT_518321 [Trichonephila clavata]
MPSDAVNDSPFLKAQYSYNRKLIWQCIADQQAAECYLISISHLGRISKCKHSLVVEILSNETSCFSRNLP